MKKICLALLCVTALSLTFTGCKKSTPTDPVKEAQEKEKHKLIDTCLGETLIRLKYPDSYSPDAPNVIFTSTGAIVMLPFEAKNSFGMARKHISTCRFEAGVLKNVSVQ